MLHGFYCTGTKHISVAMVSQTLYKGSMPHFSLSANIRIHKKAFSHLEKNAKETIQPVFSHTKISKHGNVFRSLTLILGYEAHIPPI